MMEKDNGNYYYLGYWDAARWIRDSLFTIMAWSIFPISHLPLRHFLSNLAITLYTHAGLLISVGAFIRLRHQDVRAFTIT